MNIQFLNGLSGSEEDAQQAYLEMMYNYISVNGMNSTLGINPKDALDLLRFVLSNWNKGDDQVEQAMSREDILRQAAEIEKLSFPGISFFQALYSNLEGRTTPYEVHLASFLNVPPSKQVGNFLSGTNADGSWDGNSDTDAYQNTDGSWNYSNDPFYTGNSNSSGFNWGSLFNFASNTLSTISNWGKPGSVTVYNPASTPTVQPAPTPKVVQQGSDSQKSQGLGTGTIVIIASSVAVAGLIVYLITKKDSESKPAVPGISGVTKQKIKNPPRHFIALK